MARLKDVAREAGVSIGAASSVLGGRSSTIGTSPATRLRILEAASRLGYTPSPAAVSLSTGRSNTLGLVIGNPLAFLSHPQGAIFIAGICSGAAASGYRVLLVTADREGALDPRLMDGCIVHGWVDHPTADIVERLAAQIPVASTYRRIPGTIPVVMSDHVEAKYAMAARYLYEQGHRRLAVVDLQRSSRLVKPVFEQVARQQGLDVQLTEFTDDWQARNYPTVHEIAQLAPLPTAVFAFDDDYARALIARLAYDGRRAPHDVSIFSGSTHAQGFQTTPPLTGIDCHQEQQIAQFINTFTQSLRDKSDLKSIETDPGTMELVERDSCAAPPTQPGTP
jgi:LacI family transcriptional regulator/LacI family repressor for deo operon, udp, cdd, tsx, nupC, and nupG